MLSTIALLRYWSRRAICVYLILCRWAWSEYLTKSRCVGLKNRYFSRFVYKMGKAAKSNEKERSLRMNGFQIQLKNTSASAWFGKCERILMICLYFVPFFLSLFLAFFSALILNKIRLTTFEQMQISTINRWTIAKIFFFCGIGPCSMCVFFWFDWN